MKRILRLAAFLSPFLAVLADAGQTLTLQSGGTVRIPDTLYGIVPRLVVDGSELIAIGEEAATPEGVRFEFRFPRKGVLAKGTARLSANPTAVTWRITLARDADKVEYGAILRLPQDEFGRDEIAADGNHARVRNLRLSLPQDWIARIGDETKSWPHQPFWRLLMEVGKTTRAKKGEVLEFRLDFAPADAHGNSSLRVAYAGPVVVGGGGCWVPMDHRKTIIPGSALDFSQMGFHDAPAGKHGWLKGVGDHAEFERLPGRAQRFCGVNFCGRANYPDTPEMAAVLAERIMRIGCNSLRIHHHDDALARYENGEMKLVAEDVDRLDRLVFECVRRGIYLTTDIYVSRRVKWRDLGIDRDGAVPHFKTYQMATERGFRDWCDFARLFLMHVNPYTGRRYADEPAMPFLCIQNETCLSGDFKGLWKDPELEMPEKWAAFLAEARALHPGAYPGYDSKNPPQIAMPWDETPGDAVLGGFWCWLESRFFSRAERFLREELGVKALLTGDNFGPTPAVVQEMRERLYGYCDAHAYPNGWRSWVDRPYSQPVLAKTHNPLVEGLGLVEDGYGYMRLWNKPFVVTEWDYVGVNSYRSMAGLVFGSMAAIQGWSGLWRFAYEHGKQNFLDNRGEPGLYNLTRDPLALAGERATLLLYLRGDMPLAPAALAVDATDAVLDPARARAWRSAPRWRHSDIAWSHRVGTVVRGRGAPAGAAVVARDSFERIGRERFAGVKPLHTTLDRRKGTFVVDTPRTKGVFARGGRFSVGGIDVALDGMATLFASSLDGKALESSSRILVTHLTDCRARGATFMDDLGSIIIRWRGDLTPEGLMPLFLREGRAEVSFSGFQGAYKVYALGTDGRRECELPAKMANGRLSFAASVRQPFGGCMLYEVVRE